MKLRTGFVTNSSSTSYLVRNHTSEWKSYYDLMNEICSDDWEYSYGNRLASKADRDRIAKLRRIPPHSEELLNLVYHMEEGFHSEGRIILKTQSFLVSPVEIADLEKEGPVSSSFHRNL